MPFKRMTVREQIKAKRELKHLRALVADTRSDYAGQWIHPLDGSAAIGAAIETAKKCGFTVVVCGRSNRSYGTFELRAVNMRGGQ